MWTIYSKKWGALECGRVYPSATFEGQITAHEVKRDGKDMWEKAYFPMHDVTVIIPPEGGV